MDLKLLTSFFFWCTVINVGLLFVFTLLMLFVGDFAYNLHSKWFSMSRETFSVVMYSFLGLYKVFVIVFNLIPWLSLLIIT